MSRNIESSESARIMYCVTADHLMMSCNIQQVQDVGKEYIYEVMGKYLYDIWSHNQAKVYIANNEKVLRSKYPMVFVETIVLSDGSSKSHISYKYPMLDHKQKVIGVMGESVLMLAADNDTAICLSSLSPKENHCFHLLLKGHPPKIISNFMNISPRTVEHHIANIREKLGCKSIKELLITYLPLMN